MCQKNVEIVQMFSTLRTYCKEDDSLIIEFLNVYKFFNNTCPEIVDKILINHIKLICYLVDYYKNCKKEITSIIQKTIIYLVIIHVTDDEFELSTDVFGLHDKIDVLKINSIIFPEIFKINDSKLENFWSSLEII